MFSKIRTAAATAVVAGTLLAAGAASAATVNFLGAYVGGPPVFDPNAIRMTVDCASCDGMATEAPTWSVLQAKMVSGPANSGAALEIAYVHNILGTTPAAGAQIQGTTLTTANPNEWSFTSAAAYILFKLGKDPEYALIRNNSGGEQTYTFAQVGTGAGLSHLVAFGNIAAVPLPATGLLLLGALGGLGFMRRRKTS